MVLTDIYGRAINQYSIVYRLTSHGFVLINLLINFYKISPNGIGWWRHGLHVGHLSEYVSVCFLATYSDTSPILFSLGFILNLITIYKGSDLRAVTI